MIQKDLVTSIGMLLILKLITRRSSKERENQSEKSLTFSTSHQRKSSDEVEDNIQDHSHNEEDIELEQEEKSPKEEKSTEDKNVEDFYKVLEDDLPMLGPLPPPKDSNFFLLKTKVKGRGSVGSNMLDQYFGTIQDAEALAKAPRYI
jgi:hypothetical protein